MPAFYAHYRFGKKVLEAMNNPVKAIASKHRTQFELGLQGPDILFFYKPYTPSRIARYGHHLASGFGLPLFERALGVVESCGRDSGEYAYLLGFICHFVLDGACHPYIGDMIEQTGVKHLEIEEEFEKFLLRLDGEDAIGFNYKELVPADSDICQSAAAFYENVTEAVVKTSLSDLRRVKKAFYRTGQREQTAINAVMKMTGKYAQLKGLMNQSADNPKCEETNGGLILRFDGAVSYAVEMMESFDKSLISGTAPDQRFDRNFL